MSAARRKESALAKDRTALGPDDAAVASTRFCSDLTAPAIFGFASPRLARAFIARRCRHAVVGKRVFARVADVEAALGRLINEGPTDAKPQTHDDDDDDDAQLDDTQLDDADKVLAALGLRRSVDAR